MNAPFPQFCSPVCHAVVCFELLVLSSAFSKIFSTKQLGFLLGVTYLNKTFVLFSHALGIFLVLFLLELTLYVLFVENRVGKSIGGKEGQKTVYRYSQFLKICITPVHFYERPTFVPGFANRKKSKKKTKKGKRENSPSICFAAAIVEAAHIPSSERGPTKLLSGNHTQHQAPEV